MGKSLAAAAAALLAAKAATEGGSIDAEYAAWSSTSGEVYTVCAGV